MEWKVKRDHLAEVQSHWQRRLKEEKRQGQTNRRREGRRKKRKRGKGRRRRRRGTKTTTWDKIPRAPKREGARGKGQRPDLSSKVRTVVRGPIVSCRCASRNATLTRRVFFLPKMDY